MLEYLRQKRQVSIRTLKICEVKEAVQNSINECLGFAAELLSPIDVMAFLANGCLFANWVSAFSTITTRPDVPPFHRDPKNACTMRGKAKMFLCVRSAPRASRRHATARVPGVLKQCPGHETAAPGTRHVSCEHAR